MSCSPLRHAVGQGARAIHGRSLGAAVLSRRVRPFSSTHMGLLGSRFLSMHRKILRVIGSASRA